MNGATLLYLEIAHDAGRYHGCLHRGDRATGCPLPDLALGPDARITIRGRSHTLGALNLALIDFQASFRESVFDERGQLELGRYLYAQTFGRCPGLHLDPESDVQLRIITEDEHVARLPWVLLARGGQFLCVSGWSVALGRTGSPDDCELAPSPWLLVAAPEPAGVPETQAAAHLEDLEEMLSQADHHFRRGSHLQVAQTWDELLQRLDERHFDVFYYYGHEIGDVHRTRLVFADASGKRRDVAVADLAAALRQAPDGAPTLAYVNCCYGDAGGILGAGRQLLEAVPAVVTNRTVAYIDAARRQAEAFWRATLLEGSAPHAAVANIYSRLGGLDLSLQDARWMTPVLHGHYRQWRSNPPRPRYDLDRDPHWRLKVDRVNQISKVIYQTLEMLKERRPRCLAYVWYGEAGQGVELFHQRLRVELHHVNPEVRLYEVPLRWPDDLKSPQRSFEDMLLKGFEVVALGSIPDRIRTKTRGETGCGALIYLRHEPVQSGDPITPPVLRTYLSWWDQVGGPLLQQADAFSLLGVSFVVRNPVRFLEGLEAKVGNLERQHTLIQILNEMEKLAKKDLRDFLKTHNVPIPHEKRDAILDRVLTETGGRYEQTLEMLKALVERAWDLEDQGTTESTAGAEDKEDWGM